MKELILKAKILAIRDIEIALLKSGNSWNIIPDVVFEEIKKVEESYLKEVPTVLDYPVRDETNTPKF